MNGPETNRSIKNPPGKLSLIKANILKMVMMINKKLVRN